MIMLLLTLSGILAIILALPISNEMQSQILQLIGILLSAAIALSSTTFIGNIMAGIMLRTIRSCRPGDFITLGDVTGRITEMDLLHTEVQTEFRDLVTIPNLNMVTQPMKVVRATGTMISAEVSLGFDVPCSRVFEVLIAATKEAQLKDGFAHVRGLETSPVIPCRRPARRRHQPDLGTLGAKGRDAASTASGRNRDRIDFHEHTCSPTAAAVMPSTTRRSRKKQTAAEEVVFDKADVAAKVEELRKAIEATDKQLAELDAESIRKGGARERAQAPHREARRSGRGARGELRRLAARRRSRYPELPENAFQQNRAEPPRTRPASGRSRSPSRE